MNDTRGPVAAVQSQNLYIFVLTNTVTLFSLACPLRVRSGMIKRHLMARTLTAASRCRLYPPSPWDTGSKRLQWMCRFAGWFLCFSNLQRPTTIIQSLWMVEEKEEVGSR